LPQSTLAAAGKRQGGRVKFAIVSEGKLRCFDNGVKVFEIDLSPRVATLLAKDLLAASLEMRDVYTDIA